MNDLILSIYEDFGSPDVTIKFSDRPDKRIGDDAVWDRTEAALMQALKTSGRPWTLNKGEGAFYGPKLEYVLRDAIGRDWHASFRIRDWMSTCTRAIANTLRVVSSERKGL